MLIGRLRAGSAVSGPTGSYQTYTINDDADANSSSAYSVKGNKVTLTEPVWFRRSLHNIWYLPSEHKFIIASLASDVIDEILFEKTVETLSPPSTSATADSPLYVPAGQYAFLIWRYDGATSLVCFPSVPGASDGPFTWTASVRVNVTPSVGATIPDHQTTSSVMTQIEYWTA